MILKKSIYKHSDVRCSGMVAHFRHVDNSIFSVFGHQNKSTCARQNFFRFKQSIIIHIISQLQAK